MRKVTDHKLAGLNDALEITVLDEPGHGGACHVYDITTEPISGVQSVSCRINFQNGPIAEHGVNGISGEALLAIVIDRLRCFQAGPYASNENMHALVSLTVALDWLQKRTKDRLARGVEGTSAQ